MIKVLHVVPELGSGGLEHLIQQWHSVAKRNDIEFVFSTQISGGSSYEYFQTEGCKIVVTNRIGEVGIAKFVKQYRDIIIEEKIDIIHLPVSPTSPFVLLAAKWAHCSCRISHAHTNVFNFDNGSIKSKLLVYCIKSSIEILSTLKMTGSKSASDYCFFENSNKKCVMLHNGIDINKFIYSEQKRNEKRKELGVDNDFVIGSVGRLTDQKNQLFILQILLELLKYSDSVKLLILGEGPDKTKLEDYIFQHKLNDKVLFLGTTKDLSSFYQAMDAFVFPSKYEGLGIAAVEAQTSGTYTYLSDKVPEDAIISSTTTVKSLLDSPKEWAQEIWDNRGKRIEDGPECAKKCGYDEMETNREMILIYKRIIEDE